MAYPRLLEPCRSAIRRRNAYPPLAGLKNDIRDHAESKLIHVEVQAPLHVANVNVNRLDAQVSVLSLLGPGLLAEVRERCSSPEIIKSRDVRRRTARQS